MRRVPLVVSISAAVLAVALAGPPAGAAVGGQWEQRGNGPGHTSAVASPGGLSASTVAGVQRVWSHGTAIWSGIAVSGGVIYGTSLDGRLVAVSAADGHQLWATPTCGNARQNTGLAGDTAPAVSGTAVWVSAGTSLTGIRLSTHQRFACVAVGSGAFLENVSPTLADGMVLANTAHAVLAVDAATGAPLWRAALPRGTTQDAPVVGGGRVFVPASLNFAGTKSTVYALSETDGSLLWSHTGRFDAGGLAVAGGHVYIGGSPTALRASDGAVEWTRPAYELESGVSIDAGHFVVYGGEATLGPGGFDPEGEVISFNAATGAREWTRGISSEGAGVPTVGNGVVYQNDPIDNGYVALINESTGALIRTLTHPAGSGFYDVQPVVVDGTIYVHGYSQDSGLPFLDAWALR